MTLTLIARDIYGDNYHEPTFPAHPGTTLVPEEERGHAYRSDLTDFVKVLERAMPENADVPPACSVYGPPFLTVRDVVRLPDESVAIVADWIYDHGKLSGHGGNGNYGHHALVRLGIESETEILAWWHARHLARVEAARLKVAVKENGLDNENLGRKRNEVLATRRLTASQIGSRTTAFRDRLERRAQDALRNAGLDDASVKEMIGKL